MRLRCLYGVKDDLHDFTERMLNTLTLGAMNGTADLIAPYGTAHTAILHREGQYQVELITIQPGLVIPSHVHPGTDSIEWAIAGAVRFTINGELPFDGLDDARLLRFIRGKGLRIGERDWHGGQALPNLGAMFLSFQRWTGRPCGFVADNYVGAGISLEHDLRKSPNER